MPRPYSQDLRDRVVALVVSGGSCRATAKVFGVSIATVAKWGSGSAGGAARRRWRWAGIGRTGWRADATGCWLALPRSRTLTLRAVMAELAADGVARRREQWKKYQGRLDAKRLVFIDETWAKTNMTPRHGRCACGTRLLAKVPHGRSRTLTFLAALRCDRITAPCVIDGPINGAGLPRCLPKVEQFLLPTLLAGDIVIMDNLGSHKSSIVRRLIRAAGAKLFFLPRYSPDLNPVEPVFAKLKTLLRKEDPRTIEATAAHRRLPRPLHRR